MGIFDRRKRTYYESGAVKTEFYLNLKGNKNGPLAIYYENGEVMAIINYENGVKNGKCEFYEKEGNLIREWEYKLDNLIYAKDLYKNNKIKIIDSIDRSCSSPKKRKVEFYSEGESLKFQTFYYYHEFVKEITLDGVLLGNFQKNESKDTFGTAEDFKNVKVPRGIWCEFDKNGNIKVEIDFDKHNYFNYFKETNLSKSGSQEHKYAEALSIIEIRKYDSKGCLTSKKITKFIDINHVFFLNSEENINVRRKADIDKLSLEELIDINPIAPGLSPFVINLISRVYPKAKEDFKQIQDEIDWIKGLEVIYDRPEEGDLIPNVPYHYSSGEETFDQPYEHTYKKCHLEISFMSDKDAYTYINEIMFFNGGVSSYKIREDKAGYDEGIWKGKIEAVYQNQIIRIYKAYARKIENFGGMEGITGEMVYVGIDLLPPKNIKKLFDFSNVPRGVHPESIHVNNVLLGLDKPILCNTDGGVIDGRLCVIADDMPDIIYSLNDELDIDLFKKIVKAFSASNPIVDTDNIELRKLIDSYDLLSSKPNELKTWTPQLYLEKKDTIISFIIKDKLMVSILKVVGNYCIRIDKKSDLSWEKLKITKKDKFEFYIAVNEAEKNAEKFNDGIIQFKEEFEKELESFDEEETVKKYDLDDIIDIKYWYKIICDRVDSYKRLGDDSISVFSWMYGHENEYEIKMEFEDNDFKKSWILYRIVGFGYVYSSLKKLEKKVSNLAKTLKINNHPVQKELGYKLAHAQASVYGATNYAMRSLKMGLSEIEEWFPEWDMKESMPEEALKEIHDKITKGLKDLMNTSQIVKEKNKKKQEKKIKEFEKEFKDNIEMLNLLAYDLIEDKQYNKAIGILEKNLDDNDPSHASYYDTCAMGYYYLGKYKKSLKLLNISIELDDGNGECRVVYEHYYNRARVHIELKDTNSSISDLKKAIELKEDYEDAKELLEKIENN